MIEGLVVFKANSDKPFFIQVMVLNFLSPETVLIR